MNCDCAAHTACLMRDVRMPGMDGLEVKRRLAERDARIPIVFLSGRASDEEERRARRAGRLNSCASRLAKEALPRLLQKLFRVSQRVRGDGDDD